MAKKTVLGLVLTAIITLAAGLLFTPKTQAASAPQDSNTPDFYAACVVNVARGLSNDMCTLNDSNNTKYLLYDGLDDIVFNNANYQASFATTTKTSGSISIQFPDRITLLNSSNQPLFSGDLAKDALKYGILTFSGNVYNTYEPGSKFSTINKSYSQIYGVYNSGDPKIKFLISINNDKTTQVLAEVYNIPQSSSKTSAGTVFAAKINKQALASDSTGGTVTPPASTGNTTDNSCEASSNTGFEWIFCGVLRMFDSIVNSLTGLIESLLNFDTSKYLNTNVHVAWGVFKNIATALLVIIMLVMVISQAIGGGPIDAYTIRKTLPRLVAAVILMQISWYMLIWIIGLGNDLGHGVRDLICAPFGGTSNLNLDKLVGQLGTAAAPITETAIFTGLIAAAAFSGLTIGGFALMGLTAVLSLIVGLVVLILREILIILSVILFPVAILAWILPGTQRYWKLWSDNFVKLLLLFPMIMAVIYAGRIFAYIAGNTGDLLAVFIVFVGYFLPYWFLPKTFKWGGQMFAAASSGALNATKGFRGAPTRFATSQMKSNREQRAASRNERLSYNRGRRFDRLLSAAGGFGLNREATDVRTARSRAEGRETGEKAVAQAIVGSSYEAQDHNDKLKTLDLLAQGQFDQTTGLDGKNPAMQRWALDQLATYGDWDRIDALRTNNRVDERTWQAFVAKNISAIHQNAPYLSPIRRDMSALGYNEAANWKDHSFYEFERQITSGQVRTPDGKGYTAHSDPTKQRRLGIAFASQALEDPRVRANLSADAVTTLERIRDLDSPEVSVVRPQGRGAPIVHLPSGRMIQTNPEARQNLTNALLDQRTDQMSRDNRVETIKAVSRQLADPSVAPNDPNRQAMEGYLSDLRNQAQSSNSPQATEAYNGILQQWQTELASRGQQAERDAVAQGLQGPDIVTARSNAETAANAEWARVQNAGLTPLP